MKKCNKCGIEKELLNFHKSSKEKDGYKYTCKTCILGHEPHKKPITEKLCKKCNELKSIELFSFINKEKNWRSSDCKKCRNKYSEEKRKELTKNNRLSELRLKSNYKRSKKYRLNKNFNLTIEDYESMISNQDNKCKICREIFIRTPNVDHCHTTGKVRGLLCSRCNIGLGGFRDNIEFLKSAIEYLT